MSLPYAATNLRSSIPYTPSSRWLFRFSLATLLAAFPLIFMGGLVTSHGAGLAVPDWPNSFGYNMWLFPPSQWIGGIFYEHTHRLLGTLVGFLSILLLLLAWAPARAPSGRRILTGIFLFFLLSLPTSYFLLPTSLFPHFAIGFASIVLITAFAFFCRRPESRRWLRWLILAAFLFICLQGLLGGLRVELINIHLAVLHGILAQLVLCLLAFITLATTRWWATVSSRITPSLTLRRAACVAVVLILLQLTLGAAMRHYGAGLAIPDLPLAYGHLLPPTTDAGLIDANAFRLRLADPVLLKPITLPLIWLHFSHRLGAILVSLALLTLALLTLRRPNPRPLPALAITLLALLALQLTLGLATIYFRKPADITTLHHTTGALCLMTTFLFTTIAHRLSRA